MKNSFFAKYFIYKLNSLRGIMIANIILTLAGIPTILTLVDILVRNTDNGPLLMNLEIFIAIYNYTLFIAFLIALVILALITPIVSFDFYNRHARIDMIGSLPLNYRERFFGDFLSGLTAAAVPFALSMPYILIMAQDISSLDPERYAYFFSYMSQSALVLLIVLVSAYTLSSLVVSCCGKISSSVLFSLLGFFLTAGIVLLYSIFVSANALGVDSSAIENISAITALAPAGPFFSLYTMWFGLENGGNVFFGTADSFSPVSPAQYAVMIALTVIYAAGAFFLGKYRKAELVGKDFVYKGAYAVFSTLLVIGVMGFTFMIDANDFTNTGLIVGTLAGLAIFFVIETEHNGSLKKLPKSILKYAAICAVCFAFYGITKSTDGLGIAEIVPNADEVYSIEMESNFIPATERENKFIYDDKSTIETIISEHKKLLSDKSKIETGYDISITYHLKSGYKLKRIYSSSQGSDAVREFFNIFADLPTSGTNLYGVLNSEDYSKLRFTGSITSDSKAVTFAIKPSKNDEFRQILLNDIKEHFSTELQQKGTSYVITARYTKNGAEQADNYYIYAPYEKTLAFISNPENITENADIEQGEHRTYTAKIVNGDDYLYFDFTSDSEIAKELLSLAENSEKEELSERVLIMDNTMIYKIAKSDEKRAVELILKLAE